MLKIENVEVLGWEAAIRGARNPMNSWKKSDSVFIDEEGDWYTISGDSGPFKNVDGFSTDGEQVYIGPNDLDLMTRLRNAGTDHRKFMRMITVYLDITAPLYWWKEFDTYKVGTVANSCSTMHKIADKEFTLDDFSHEHLIDSPLVEEAPGKPALLNMQAREMLVILVNVLNAARYNYLKTKNKKYWWQMIQLLPSSYNQKRTVMLNYEVLANMYKSRRNHKLDEWHTLCDWIEQLPYSELVTGKTDVVDKINAVGNPNPVSPEDIRKGLENVKGE